MISDNALQYYRVIPDNALRHYHMIPDDALRHFSISALDWPVMDLCTA